MTFCTRIFDFSSCEMLVKEMRARSLLFDLWADYIQHVGGEVWTSTLAQYLTRFGIREATLRQALSRMSREGWIQPRRVGSRSCYSLTPRGKRRLVEASRRVYDPVDAAWDGQWRILAYSIPEPMRTKRDELRRELTWTGFAALTTGTWITPNPLGEALQELITRYGIAAYVATFVGRHTGPESPQALVRRCWDLDGIQAGYGRFVERWAPRAARWSTGAALTGDECFVEKVELVHDYRKFLFVDPGLPRELLPDHWRGFAARALFQEYYGLLQPGALEFQESLFEPTVPRSAEAD